ncbi:TPA: hypothetical protein NNU28_004382 [Salmonella enterica]|nr:hypothetical protein [Salmonella enterica]
MIKSKGRYHRTIWTPEELEFVKTYSRHWHEREYQVLVQYYPVEGMAVADRLPGRTRASMRQAAYSMGLKFPARLPHIRGTSSVGGLFFALNPIYYQMMAQFTSALSAYREHNAIRLTISRRKKTGR